MSVKLSTETLSLRRIRHVSLLTNLNRCATLLMSAMLRSPTLSVVLSLFFHLPSMLSTSSPLLLSSFSYVVWKVIQQMMPVVRSVVLMKVRAKYLRRETVLPVLMRPGETQTLLNAADRYFINPGAVATIIRLIIISVLLHHSISYSTHLVCLKVIIDSNAIQYVLHRCCSSFNSRIRK